MRFIALPLKGAYLIETQPHIDERGSFTRFFCSEEFKKQGLITQFVQASTAFNYRKGQIRGMHYQEPPYAETKLVCCMRGAIYDVILDIRPNSSTYQQYYGLELSVDNKRMLYIPKGFAHGYKTLVDHSEVLYMMDEFYEREKAKEISYKKYFTVKS